MIIVNATSCKVGGAKQIVERFIEDYEFPEKLIVIGPTSLVISQKVHRYIPIETNGIMTMLFSILFVGWFVLKYKAHTVFSFSNINLIIPFCQRVTYFHQLKILTTNNLRFKVFRFIIRYFLCSKSKFIFQTSYVNQMFTKVFGDYKSEVCWPGVHLPPDFKASSNNDNFTALIPYAYPDLPQKNFRFFLDKDWCSLQKLTAIYIPAIDGEVHHKKFNYLGNQTREKMNKLYQEVDLLFIASLEETVCLPIFEFASTGKPALVLSSPYIVEISKEIELPKNIIIFNIQEFDKVVLEVLTNYQNHCEFNQDKIIRMQKSHWPKLIN